MFGFLWLWPFSLLILVSYSSGFSPSWSMFHMFTYFTCHIRFYLFHMCFICYHVLHVWCLQYILNFLQRVFWGKASSCAWSLVLGVWEIQVVRSGSEKSRWWVQWWVLVSRFDPVYGLGVHIFRYQVFSNQVLSIVSMVSSLCLFQSLFPEL